MALNQKGAAADNPNAAAPSRPFEEPLSKMAASTHDPDGTLALAAKRRETLADLDARKDAAVQAERYEEAVRKGSVGCRSSHCRNGYEIWHEAGGGCCGVTTRADPRRGSKRRSRS